MRFGWQGNKGHVVAPHAGAWIEIYGRDELTVGAQGVAPHAGAWIEIRTSGVHNGKYPSHPMRVRGLKFPSLSARRAWIESHPMRVRGLKSAQGSPLYRFADVAPHTGAWIEMTSSMASRS